MLSLTSYWQKDLPCGIYGEALVIPFAKIFPFTGNSFSFTVRFLSRKYKHETPTKYYNFLFVYLLATLGPTVSYSLPSVWMWECFISPWQHINRSRHHSVTGTHHFLLVFFFCVFNRRNNRRHKGHIGARGKLASDYLPVIWQETHTHTPITMTCPADSCLNACTHLNTLSHA